jgi:hypothetical protein
MVGCNHRGVKSIVVTGVISYLPSAIGFLFSYACLSRTLTGSGRADWGSTVLILEVICRQVCRSINATQKNMLNNVVT